MIVTTVAAVEFEDLPRDHLVTNLQFEIVQFLKDFV